VLQTRISSLDGIQGIAQHREIAGDAISLDPAATIRGRLEKRRIQNMCDAGYLAKFPVAIVLVAQVDGQPFGTGRKIRPASRQGDDIRIRLLFGVSKHCPSDKPRCSCN